MFGNNDLDDVFVLGLFMIVMMRIEEGEDVGMVVNTWGATDL